MDEATRRHIFEPFFTTRRQGRGRSLGLGLATVYGIVKQNNGYIFVTSGVASGTTFNLYLHPFLSRTAAVPEGRAWQTVLLVDEDDAMRALAREELRREGYVVLEAKHAADALRIAERHPDEIHVLLTSLSLPHMSGRDLASRLSTERPRLKRILAAPTTESLTHQEIADGAFLRRPYAPDALLSSVRHLLRADSHQP
jgi:CheY-like chemotaxis protein